MELPETGEMTSLPWSVIVLDENEIRGKVTAKWIKEGLPCKNATSHRDLLTQLDQTCIVVCIRETGNESDELIRDIWDINPHTQLLILLDRGAFTGLDRICDEQLQEPYGKNDIQQAVVRLFGRGLYSLKLQQYYRLSSYLTGQEDFAEEAAEEAMEELKEQCARVEAEITTIANTFEQPDLEEILLAHRQREKYLGTSSIEVEEESSSKYRPSRCPSCGLAWGAAHGGQLKDGCEQIAALVWRCRGCRDILRISPGEYDKIL